MLFVSFLVRPLDAVDTGHPGNYFVLDYGTIAVGCGSSNYYWLDNAPFGRSDKINSSARVVVGETAFLVLRVTFGAPDQKDTVDLFVNPAPGRLLPPLPDATKSDRNTGVPKDFDIRSTIRCVFDEIRFGRTFAEVAPTR